MKKNSGYIALGLMSGTSLDGLDLCLAQFEQVKGNWKYQILASQTISYSSQLRDELLHSPEITAQALVRLDYSYGLWVGEQVNRFIAKNRITPDLIASHGHTVFHDPQQGYTLQIGKGSAIAATTGICCVSDFRSTDICLGGQGAPLVPIGDELLFSDFDICLNLGGIANISYKNIENKRVAYDICPCNMVLNYLSNKFDKPFDKDGEIGKSGIIIPELLDKFNKLSYYSLPLPKSLAREWFEEYFLPIVKSSDKPINNILRTTYEHISYQIAKASNVFNNKNLLLTGGGAHNTFLIQLIRSKSSCNVVVPEQNTIDFKEALVFAFLGVLYIAKQEGALASATGAKRNSIAGCMYR